MTPAEFDFFTNQMQTSKQKTQTDFFLAVLRKKPIIVIENLRPVLLELKRHGNNLNQITRHLNETKTLEEGAKKVMNECWKAYHAITQLEKVIQDASIQRQSITNANTTTSNYHQTQATTPPPQQCHQLAERMVQQLFSAHECVIATHTDTDTMHSHIIINAVSFETGKKFHMNLWEYRDSKDLASKLTIAAIDF